MKTLYKVVAIRWARDITREVMKLQTDNRELEPTYEEGDESGWIGCEFKDEIELREAGAILLGIEKNAFAGKDGGSVKGNTISYWLMNKKSKH